MATLEKLNIDNLALRSLPIDKEERIVPRSVPGACFSRYVTIIVMFMVLQGIENIEYSTLHVILLL